MDSWYKSIKIYNKMNSFYKTQTKVMVTILQETGTLNVVRDFYAQLSNIRPIHSLSIINALNAGEMDSSKLIQSSVMQREWMSHISLEDIRNHVIFTIWKEHQTVVWCSFHIVKITWFRISSSDI